MEIVDRIKVIKHRAPNGALRLPATTLVVMASSHKAPSAKRCIKTVKVVCHLEVGLQVIKHRAPNGALRRANLNRVLARLES